MGKRENAQKRLFLAVFVRFFRFECKPRPVGATHNCFQHNEQVSLMGRLKFGLKMAIFS